MATLLLVILIPRLLPPQYIPLGLGIHKSMEMASSSLSQTLGGLWLDWSKDTITEDDEGDEYEAGEGLLRVFWMINIFQLGCIFLLWRFEARRRLMADERRLGVEEYEQLPMEGVGEESVYEDEDNIEGGSEDDPNSVWAGGSPGLKRITTEEPDDTEEESKIGSGPRPQSREASSAVAADDNERRRARWYLFISLGFIGVVWTVFLVSAWSRL